jgi:hypothetical protein
MAYRTIVGGAVVAFVVGVTAGLSGQAPHRGATLDDVVTEIRQLRADIKATAQAGVRAQALMSRSALQEQRLRAVSDNLNRARAELKNAIAQRTEGESRLEEFLAAPVVGNPMGRDDMLARMKRDIEVLRRNETSIRGQVTHWEGVVGQEQGRWEDLNRRVEELER